MQPPAGHAGHAGHAEPQHPPSLHRTVAGLGIATIASYGGWFYGFGVLVQPIADDTGWSLATLGGAYAAGQLLTGLGASLGGRLLDLHGGRWVFGVAGLLGGLLLAVAALATTPWVFATAFAAGAAVVGANGFYHVTMAAARRLRPTRPAKAIGPLTIWGAFASPIFLPVTAWLVEGFGWRVALGALAITTAVGLLTASALAGGGRAGLATDGPEPSLAQAARSLWTDTAARRLLLMTAGSGFGIGMILAYQVPVMVSLGLPLATAAAVAGSRGLLQLAGRLGLTRIVDTFGARRPLAAVHLAAVLATVLLAGSGSLPIAIAYAVVAGTALGATSPLAGIYGSEILPQRHLGALLGAVHAIGGAAGAAGPLVGGLTATATGSYGLAVTLAGMAFLVAAAAVASRPGMPSDADPWVASGADVQDPVVPPPA